jgi:hypothetical protein
MRDSFFGGTHDIGTPNDNMTIKTTYAGWEKEVQGPCRLGLAEMDMMEDILTYRRQACDHSADHTFRLLARDYRAYLGACISLIDAFINRHILVATHDGFASPEFERLKASKNTEERVELWLDVCSEKPKEHLFRTKEWCHFQALRQKRNELAHAVSRSPYIASRRSECI